MAGNNQLIKGPSIPGFPQPKIGPFMTQVDEPYKDLPFLYGHTNIEDLFYKRMSEVVNDLPRYRYYVVKQMDIKNEVSSSSVKNFESGYYSVPEGNARSLFAQRYYQLESSLEANSRYNVHIVTSVDGKGLIDNAALVLPRPMDLIFWIEDNTGDKVSNRVVLCSMGETLRERLKKEGLLTTDSPIIKQMSAILDIDAETMLQLFQNGKADASWELEAAHLAGRFLTFTMNISSFIDSKTLASFLNEVIKGLELLKFDEKTWLPEEKDTNANNQNDNQVVKAVNAVMKNIAATLKTVDSIVDRQSAKTIGNSKWLTDKYRKMLAPAKVVIADAFVAVDIVSGIVETLAKYPISMAKAYLCGLVNGFIEGIIGIVGLLKMIFEAGEFLSDIKGKWSPLSEAIDNLLDAWHKFKFSEFFNQVKDHIVSFLEEVAGEVGDGIEEKTACEVAYFMGNLIGQITEFVLEILAGAFFTGGSASVASTVSRFVRTFEKSVEIFKGLTRIVLELDINAIVHGIAGALAGLAALLQKLGANAVRTVLFIIRELKTYFKIGLSAETEALFKKLGITYKGRRLRTSRAMGSGPVGFEIIDDGAVYKGRQVAANKKEAEELAEKLRHLDEAGQKKFLDKIFSENIFATWAAKFDKKFHFHFDGEIKIKINGDGEYFVLEGAHNHDVIGTTIQLGEIRKPPGVSFSNLPDDIPFKANVELKYNSSIIKKKATSSFFPKNWSIERVKQEIALVYDKMIQSGFELKWSNNKFKALDSSGKFEIQIEVDELGDLTSAYPMIK